MKKLFLVLVLMMVGAGTTFAETSIDGGKGKKHHSGFNYRKHYRKQRRVQFFDNLFDRKNCNHYRRNGWV